MELVLIISPQPYWSSLNSTSHQEVHKKCTKCATLFYSTCQWRSLEFQTYCLRAKVVGVVLPVFPCPQTFPEGKKEGKIKQHRFTLVVCIALFFFLNNFSKISYIYNLSECVVYAKLAL